VHLLHYHGGKRIQSVSKNSVEQRKEPSNNINENAGNC